VGETRKLAAILVSDVVGYSRLASADEDRILARLRALRSDLIDPTIAVHHGRVVKRTGDGSIVEFRSVVDAVNCAIEVQRAMVERNAGVPEDRRIVFRIGIHLGDVVEESDGDLMGDGVNIAARLEGICEPGAICMSEDAYRQVKGRLDLAANNLGPTQLKNIAEPIRVYALDVGMPTVAKPAPTPVPDKSAPPRLSMVVLPFANIGGDPEQEHFVDGVMESLTTDLSRIRGAVVIARNTAFTYKGKPLDVKTIGRELNVRYVLEGSVQRGGNRMRLNVQLIDAETGNHLWAERFDKPLADLFDMQDEIVARLAGALNAQLIAAEARRAEKAPNPDSMDLYFQGMSWVNKGRTPENVAQARSLFDRALAADPDNVDALIGSAGSDVLAGSHVFVTNPTTAFAAAEAKLTEALSSVPDHALAHVLLGYVEIVTKRGAQGIAKCEHALHGSKSRSRPSPYRTWQDFDRPRRRNGGPHCRGPAPQSARHVGLYLDESRGRGEALSWQLRASGRVLSAVDRGQPKLFVSIFSVVRRARAAWSTWRGALRRQGGPRAQSDLHHFPRPHCLDGDERRPDVFGLA
jgi:TolB-like protein/class 3 adenylate cyclase